VGGEAPAVLRQYVWGLYVDELIQQKEKGEPDRFNLGTQYRFPFPGRAMRGATTRAMRAMREGYRRG